MTGSPSVVKPQRLFQLKFNIFKHCTTSSKSSSADMRSFMLCKDTSFSVIVNSWSIPRTKMSNCAVSEMSVLSSKAKAKKENVSAVVCNWSCKFWPMFSTRRVMEGLERLTSSNAEHLSGPISSTAAMMHFFRNLLQLSPCCSLATRLAVTMSSFPFTCCEHILLTALVSSLTFFYNCNWDSRTSSVKLSYFVLFFVS